MKTTSTSGTNQLPTRAQVAKRAHQIYLERGAQPGHELDDWFQAEYELMKLPVHKIAELSPGTSSKRTSHALIALVQAAMVLGAQGLRSAHWR